MDFTLNTEQLDLKNQIIEFAETNLNSDTLQNDVESTFDRAKWDACARHGIQGLNIPKEYGGSGRDILSTVVALEALGYGCNANSLPYSITSQMLTVQHVILKFGSEEMKDKYLPRFCRGEMIGAFGITEEKSGSDSYALEMTAEKVDGGYILNGRKSFITHAPICDMAIVFATTDPSRGKWGISAFAVDYGAKGFERTTARDKMGMRTTQMGDLVFENCFVDEKSRIGKEGIGVSMFAKSMESERAYIFACQVGRMQRQLEDAVAFSRERMAFGKPISSFQGVAHRLANMKLRLETSRLLLYHVAWRDMQKLPVLMDAALVKLHISEAFVASSLDSVRIHGVRGYVTEYEIERDMRDGIGGLIYSGTSEIQRNIISRLLEAEV